MSETAIDVALVELTTAVEITEPSIEVSHAGPQGPQGADGQGVPTGGTAGQPLVKINATNFNTQWSTLANFKTWLALTLSDITTALGFTPANTSHTHTTPDIVDDAVTFQKFQNIGTDRLIGRDTAATGDPEEISLNATLEFTGAGAVQRAALAGDVTAAAGSNTTAIAADAVTYAKIQNVSATDKVLGRSTAGAGDVEEIACTAAARAFLDDIDATAQRNTLVLGTTDTVQFGKAAIGVAPASIGALKVGGALNVAAEQSAFGTVSVYPPVA